jgi:hypothetical protein
MDKDEYAAALAELAALGDARVAAEAALKALSEQSVAAVLDALKRGIRPADVARSLHYTDGYVRKIGRPKGVQPDPRYAHLKPPSRAKPVPEPIAAPTVEPSSQFLPPEPPIVAAPLSREAELLAMADELTSERVTELNELMYQRNQPWYQLNRRSGTTEMDMVRKGIRDGKLTASDLRN